MSAITKRTSKAGNTSYIVAIRKRGAKPVYRTFLRRVVAERWARETETAIENGKYINYSQSETMLFSDAIQRYKDTILINQAESTIKSVGPAMTKIGRYFKGITLAHMSTDTIMDYVLKLKTEGNVKDNTILTRLGHIHLILNACNVVWKIECPNNILDVKTICRMNRTLAAEPSRDRRPTESETLSILAFTEIKHINLMAEFAINTAMRRSEISKLLYTDINYTINTLYIPRENAKNGKAREIPLTLRAVEILRLMQKDYLNINGRVFNHSSDMITNKFTAMCESLGIEDLHFHDLRHEAISRFFEQTNLTVLEISQISGHSNMQMLKRYTHVRAGYLAKQLAEQMG